MINITKRPSPYNVQFFTLDIPARICHVQLANLTNGNFLGSQEAQQMNEIQVNHENMSDQVNKVQAVDNCGLDPIIIYSVLLSFNVNLFTKSQS